MHSSQRHSNTSNAIWHTYIRSRTYSLSSGWYHCTVKIEFVCMHTNMFRRFLSHYVNHLPSSQQHTRETRCSCSRLYLLKTKRNYRPTNLLTNKNCWTNFGVNWPTRSKSINYLQYFHSVSGTRCDNRAVLLKRKRRKRKFQIHSTFRY